jgi:hypothetical protein
MEALTHLEFDPDQWQPTQLCDTVARASSAIRRAGMRLGSSRNQTKGCVSRSWLLSARFVDPASKRIEQIVRQRRIEVVGDQYPWPWSRPGTRGLVASAGTSRATGRPCRVDDHPSPPLTWSIRRDRWTLAASMFIL